MPYSSSGFPSPLMALPAQPYRPTTPEAYLEWEEAQMDRHEFYRGEVFAMAGGTYTHSRITANVMSGLHAALTGRGCHVLSGDMRVHVHENGLYTYPDVSVVCGEPQFKTERETTLVNPTLLVEVLSDSTERYDRGTKFRLYRELESLQEYLLVAQRSRLVEVYRRDPQGWRLFDTDAEGRIELLSVGATLTMDAIYDGLEIPDREPPPEPEPPPEGMERF